MAPPQVAVLVPVHNRPVLVLEALRSLGEQTFPHWRLIVIDDGSTDDTAQRVRQWIAAAGPALDMRFITQENRGVAAARNRGAMETEGCELLAFLDSDDLWLPGMLAAAAAALAAAPAAVAVTVDCRDFDHLTGKEAIISGADYVGAATPAIFFGKSPYPCTTVIRTTHFHQLGGFDEAMFWREDRDLFLRVSTLGRWLHIPEVLALRRLDMPGNGSLSRRMYQKPQSIDSLARLHERFIYQYGGREALAGRPWRRHLAATWYEAGKRYHWLGKEDEARECFAKGWRTCPWHRRSAKRFLGAVACTAAARIARALV